MAQDAPGEGEGDIIAYLLDQLSYVNSDLAGINASLGTALKDYTTGLVANIPKLFEQLRTYIGNTFVEHNFFIKTSLQNLFDSTRKEILTAVADINGIVNNRLNHTDGLINGIASQLTSITDSILKPIMEDTAKILANSEVIIDKIDTMMEELAARLAEVLQKVTDEIKALGADIEIWINDAVSTIQEELSDLKEDIKLGFEELGSLISDEFKQLSEDINGYVNELIDELKTGFSDTQESINDGFSSMSNDISESISDLQYGIEDIADDFYELFEYYLSEFLTTYIQLNTAEEIPPPEMDFFEPPFVD